MKLPAPTHGSGGAGIELPPLFHSRQMAPTDIKTTAPPDRASERGFALPPEHVKRLLRKATVSERRSVVGVVSASR
ncbi:hypothetical protein MRX96_036575 [Rhipicephalus microplus]